MGLSLGGPGTLTAMAEQWHVARIGVSGDGGRTGNLCEVPHCEAMLMFTVFGSEWLESLPVHIISLAQEIWKLDAQLRSAIDMPTRDVDQLGFTVCNE